MAIDKENRYLATGDVDGLIKTWDISQYCMDEQDESDMITEPPSKFLLY